MHPNKIPFVYPIKYVICSDVQILFSLTETFWILSLRKKMYLSTNIISQEIVHINIGNINTNATGFVLNMWKCPGCYSAEKNRYTTPAKCLRALKSAQSQFMSQANVLTAGTGKGLQAQWIFQIVSSVRHSVSRESLKLTEIQFIVMSSWYCTFFFKNQNQKRANSGVS